MKPLMRRPFPDPVVQAADRRDFSQRDKASADTLWVTTAAIAAAGVFCDDPPPAESRAAASRRMDMGSLSIGHWLIVLVIVLLLFGANKIPRLMGDMAKGVKAFKQGLKDGDEEPAAAPAAQIQAPPPVPPQPAATPAAPTEPAHKP
jgi:sec-independent protein translocase protein TatA